MCNYHKRVGYANQARLLGFRYASVVVRKQMRAEICDVLNMTVAVRAFV